MRWDLPYRTKPSLQRVIKILPDILTQARSKSPPNSSLQTSIGQIEILKNRAEEIIYNIMSIYKVQDSSLMGKIKKRAVVAPFIGDALSFLFGTAKQSSIDEVKKRIMTLQAKNDQIVHVLSERLTLVNVTHQATRQNVKHIRHLQEAVTLLTSNLSTQITEMYTQNYANIITHSFETLIDALRAYENSIRILYNHKLPSHIIRPTELKKVLTVINQKINGKFMLPFPINKLTAYYNSLPVQFYLEKRLQTIILFIPLIRPNHVIQLRKISNIPVPYKNTPLWAQYVIPEKLFLLSTNGDKYIPITKSELDKCLVADKIICEMHHPLWKVSHSTLPCFLAIFFRSSDIQKACQKNVFSSKNPVKAIRVNKASWWVSTQITIQMLLECDEQTDQHTTIKKLDRGLHLIPAIPHCSWTNRHLHLITGGILHKDILKLPDNTESIDFKIPEIKIPQFQQKFFNNAFTDDTIWDYSFLQNKVNQKNLEANHDKIFINKTISSTAFTLIAVAIICVAIGVIICFKFRDTITQWVMTRKQSYSPKLDQVTTNIYPVLANRLETLPTIPNTVH